MSNASETQAGWRIPRACQECRKRKIKCSGLTPCTTCHLRNTPCIYRDYIRHRRKKNEYDGGEAGSPRRASPSVPPSGPRTSSVMNDFPNSVSATHMASPSCQMELYYGPTSHFSLMQHIYRDLISNPTAPPEPSGGVEEAGAGLDLFSFRRIFFGTPDSHSLDSNRPLGTGEMSMMFLPYDLAKLFMSRFLSSLYHMMPHRSKASYEQCLELLYNPCQTESLDTLTQAIILLAMACAALGTDHFAWGDVLFERVKASMSRPNSAFLHLGSASRKALSAGLHKDVPHGADQTPESIEERRVTFWSLYIYETWFCFHVGRPCSLSLKDVAIECAQDPFIRLLAALCKTITRSAEEVYGQRHESLLHMWKVAKSIGKDLRSHEALLQQSFGFGVDAGPQAGSLGVRQIIFTTLYNHTLLLTFRPFLIFRGRWQRDKKTALNTTGNPAIRPREAPPWLNEACNHATTAAQRTLQQLCEASRVNDLVRQLRYHGYFLGSSSFTLIYEFLHDETLAPVYLPWVYASLQALSTMRAGDPVASSISAIQTVLRRMNPAYEWSPYTGTHRRQNVPERAVMQQGASQHTQRPLPNDPAFPPKPPTGIQSALPASPWSLPPVETLEMPETGGSVGSGEDMLDFTQSDMGWDFDFSTMDLEAFLSVYPSNEAVL